MICAILSLLLVFPTVLFVTAEERDPFSGEVQKYYEELISLGFPDDYAHSLTKLHLLHPTWSFVPLLITETEESYTWDYVIKKENVLDNAGKSNESANNTISKDASYIAYRHPTNTKLYDSGKYQVSDEALAYFMDPRNFLNETDIFQFLDLSAYQGVTKDAVNSVLAGTFMENKMLENGKSFAEYFLEVGAELGVNPIFLAVKARQEQGVNGTSPIISGSCGDSLYTLYQDNPSLGDYTEDELRQFNGYYNLFNVKASGNGHFAIYYNAMSYAKNTGTPSMEEAWGSPSWDTLWKSLYGGAAFIKKNYVSDYVTTIYLQKFNVDSRAYGNFWKQYMQNVTGAFSEARSFYTSFASTGMLDSECSFLIPVYGGMPSSPSPDPANGECGFLLAADHRYQTTVDLATPTRASEQNTYVIGSFTVNRGEEISCRGSVTHSYGVNRLEYSWDGERWQTLCQGGMLNASIPVHHDSASSHILVIRGIADYDGTSSSKKSNYAFLCALFYVEVNAPETLTVLLNNGSKPMETVIRWGEDYQLPEATDQNFVGWLSSDGKLYRENEVFTPVKDISLTPVSLDLCRLVGASLIFDEANARLRFFAAVQSESYTMLADASVIDLYASYSKNGNTVQITPPVHKETVYAHGTDWQLLYVDTQEISVTGAEDVYAAVFSASVTYADGTRRIIHATVPEQDSLERTVQNVAIAALRDTAAQYSSDLIQRLSAYAAT